MVSTAVIGAIVGVVIGLVLLIVLITCIVYISKKLKRKTNARSKIISADGVVIKDNWAEDEDTKKYFSKEENRTYFGHIDRTEHVEVKEKRRREEFIIPPEPQPPPAAPPVVAPPVSPPRPAPRLARYRLRSWPKRLREPPPVRRRASIGHAEGVKHLAYGIPYPVTSRPTVPAAPKPAPEPPVPSAPPAPNPAVETLPVGHKCQSVEEQERVLVIDDTMTEKSYNPLVSNNQVSATVSDNITDTITERKTERSETLVPKIITDLM